MSLRISIIGKKDSVISWQYDLIDAFEAVGATVHFHNIKSVSLKERMEQCRHKRKQLQNQATSLRLGQELKNARPDLVIVLNKVGLPEFTNETWRNFMPSETPIIGWICDRITAFPTDCKPSLNGLYYFDSSDKICIKNAYADRPARINYLPLAASPKRFHYQHTQASDIKPKLVFVGHCSPTRRTEIEAYRAIGGEIEVYGPKSKGLCARGNNRSFNYTEQAALYRTHTACFNPLQIRNTLDGLNLRTFEVPLAGGLGCYSRQAKDLTTCFEPGREILAYDSLEDLKEQIHELRRDPERMLQMRAAGRDRVLREHTFIHRAQKIIHDWLPEYSATASTSSK